MSASFQAGGLASGLDTNALIDGLVQIRGASLNLLKSKQSAYSTQLSAMGDLVSKLSAFKLSAVALTSGVTAAKSQGTLTGLTVTPGTQAQTGRYTVEVVALAAAAKQRSAGQASGFTSAGGTLDIDVDGDAVSVNVAAGTSLANLAAAINAQAPKVSAAVLFDGTSSYLSITNRSTGHQVGGLPADALQLTGAVATELGFTQVTAAQNATLEVDGLSFERTTNTFSDVLSGVGFTLTKVAAAQDLVLESDVTQTAANLKGFVDSYNSILGAVQRQLQVAPGTRRQASLTGDGAVKGLQTAMQALTAREVGTGTVRSLADLGLKTARDGSLSLDTATLAKALERDAAAADAVFSTATTGIATVAQDLVDDYTNATDGVLTLRSKGLSDTVDRLGDDIERAQASLDRYRDLLVQQYTAMEKVVGGLKSIGSFLDQQDTARKAQG